MKHSGLLCNCTHKRLQEETNNDASLSGANFTQSPPAVKVDHTGIANVMAWSFAESWLKIKYSQEIYPQKLTIRNQVNDTKKATDCSDT